MASIIMNIHMHSTKYSFIVQERKKCGTRVGATGWVKGEKQIKIK